MGVHHLYDIRSLTECTIHRPGGGGGGEGLGGGGAQPSLHRIDVPGTRAKKYHLNIQRSSKGSFFLFFTFVKSSYSNFRIMPLLLSGLCYYLVKFDNFK